VAATGLEEFARSRAIAGTFVAPEARLARNATHDTNGREEEDMRRWRALAALAGAMCLAGVGLADPAQAAGPYKIVNVGSNKCVSTPYNNLSPGSDVTQWTCLNPLAPSQRWILEPHPFKKPDGFRFVRADSDPARRMCLSGKTYNSHNTRAYQDYCETESGNLYYDDAWRVIYDWQAGTYEIRSLASPAVCLSIYGQTDDNGGLVNLWNCFGSSYQKWRILPP